MPPALDVREMGFKYKPMTIKHCVIENGRKGSLGDKYLRAVGFFAPPPGGLLMPRTLSVRNAYSARLFVRNYARSSNLNQSRWRATIPKGEAVDLLCTVLKEDT